MNSNHFHQTKDRKAIMLVYSEERIRLKKEEEKARENLKELKEVIADVAAKVGVVAVSTARLEEAIEDFANALATVPEEEAEEGWDILEVLSMTVPDLTTIDIDITEEMRERIRAYYDEVEGRLSSDSGIQESSDEENGEAEE